MRKKLALALATVLVSAVAAGSAPASHSWGGYHWARTANPFTIKLGDNVSAGWKPYLATASSDWSKSTVLDTVVVTGQAKGRCRPTSGRVEVCSGAYGFNGWLGLAQIWLSGKHITQGAVKVNDSYFNSPPYNTPEEKTHVMCQEVGHTFGLDHQDESGASLGTCMDYSTSPASQHPNAHDYEELEIIYSHLDSTTTVGASAGFAPDVRTVLRGRESVQVRDLGGGRKIVTFIFWVAR